MQKLTQLMQKVLPPRRLRFPLLGLMLVVGVVADRSRPVYSSQFDPDPYTYRVVQTQPGVKVLEIQPDYGDETQSFAEQPQIEQTPIEPPDWSDIAPGQINHPILIAATSPNQLPRANRNFQTGNLPQTDGTYLYGQVPQTGENNQGYIVFEKTRGQVVGALYMPNSEYSCFRGSVDNTGAIAMTVQGYAGESSPVQVATNSNNINLDINAPSPYAHSLALSDYYRLPSLTANDKAILKACQTQR